MREAFDNDSPVGEPTDRNCRNAPQQDYSVADARTDVLCTRLTLNRMVEVNRQKRFFSEKTFFLFKKQFLKQQLEETVLSKTIFVEKRSLTLLQNITDIYSRKCHVAPKFQPFN